MNLNTLFTLRHFPRCVKKVKRKRKALFRFSSVSSDRLHCQSKPSRADPPNQVHWLSEADAGFIDLDLSSGVSWISWKVGDDWFHVCRSSKAWTPRLFLLFCKQRPLLAAAGARRMAQSINYCTDSRPGPRANPEVYIAEVPQGTGLGTYGLLNPVIVSDRK